MKWEAFHHPDISLPVIRRKAGDELITLLAGTACFILSKGASEIYGHCYPNERAFRASLTRLQKKGLLVTRHTDGSFPELQLSPFGESRLPAYYTPQAYWLERWNEWWYVLVFDVPEKERKYRNTLRSFLKRLRFGCLQKSVWVTARDVRPDYDDLDRAAAIDSIAFLFEARTVLGYGDQSVVQVAWDFTRLNEIQCRYIHFARTNLALLDQSKLTKAEAMQLLRLENEAYSKAMFLDPLLPEKLHPKGYRGKTVYALHRKLLLKTTDKL